MSQDNSAAVEKYLSPTPESFLELAKLCKCDRLYLAPVYHDYLNLLLHPPRRSMTMMPRGSFKSTWLCLSVLRDIIINPNIRILYASETMPNAKKYLLWIRQQFESNDELRKLFGDFVADTRWREDEITVRGRTDFSKKEPTLSCAGLGVTKTGMHYDKIIIDDPVGESNRGTREAIEKVTDWFQMLLSIAEEVVDPDTGLVTHSTVVVVNGTPYDDNDVFGHIQRVNAELLKKQASGDDRIQPYVILKKPAEDDKGECPFNHLPRPVLEQMKIEKGSRFYSSQMLLDPVPAGFALFKRSQFKMLSKHDLPPLTDMNTYMLTDTATSEGRECDTVLAILSKDYIGNAYIQEMMVGKWAPATVIANLTSLYVKWNCRGALMEKIAINEVYGAMIDAWCRGSQQRIRIIPVFGRTTESKALRIQSLQPRFEAGTIFFSSAIDKELIRVENGQCYGKIVEEFVRFSPYIKGHDVDIPDCLSDMDKQDSNGSPLCPAPRMVRAPQRPGMVNNRYAGQPAAAAPAGNFWNRTATDFMSRGRR